MEIEAELKISVQWTCEQYRLLIDETLKAEQFNVTLNALNSIVYRLIIFEELLDDSEPVYYQSSNKNVKLKLNLHPGYEIRE